MVKLSGRFPNFELDDFQIMPEHMHGIIKLVQATLAVAQFDALNPNDAVAEIDALNPNNAVA